MSDRRTLIICQSVHHGSTLKVAKALAEVLNAEIRKPSEVDNRELEKYDLIGFGSGIYDDKHHLSLLALVDGSPDARGKNAFIFSTSGVPVALFGNGFLQNYRTKAHGALKKKLLDKGYEIAGECILPGYNTNVFLKYFGGINKNRPDENDLNKAKEFAGGLTGH